MELTTGEVISTITGIASALCYLYFKVEKLQEKMLEALEEEKERCEKSLNDIKTHIMNCQHKDCSLWRVYRE